MSTAAFGSSTLRVTTARWAPPMRKRRVTARVSMPVIPATPDFSIQIRQRALGAPVRHARGQVAHHEAGTVGPVRLEVPPGSPPRCRSRARSSARSARGTKDRSAPPDSRSSRCEDQLAGHVSGRTETQSPGRRFRLPGPARLGVMRSCRQATNLSSENTIVPPTTVSAARPRIARPPKGVLRALERKRVASQVPGDLGIDDGYVGRAAERQAAAWQAQHLGRTGRHAHDQLGWRQHARVHQFPPPGPARFPGR